MVSLEEGKEEEEEEEGEDEEDDTPRPKGSFTKFSKFGDSKGTQRSEPQTFNPKP